MENRNKTVCSEFFNLILEGYITYKYTFRLRKVKSWFLLKKIIVEKINRKLRVATKIGRTFFWFLTSYRAAEIMQNDYLSSAWNFRSIEYHHALFLNFGTLAGLWPFERALTCSILIAGTQVMLRKAYFLKRGSWLRPEFWTPRPRIKNFGPYYWDAHTNGLLFKISAL
jgi:hypothetical protein